MGDYLMSDFLFGSNIWNFNGLFFTILWLLTLIYLIKLVIEKVLLLILLVYFKILALDKRDNES